MSHHQHENYLTLEKDLTPDNLPKGQPPIWIKPPKKATRKDMLEQVAMIPEIGELLLIGVVGGIILRTLSFYLKETEL